MKIEEIKEDLNKFINYIERSTDDPTEDKRYRYAKEILRHYELLEESIRKKREEIRGLQTENSNITRELLSRTNKMLQK